MPKEGSAEWFRVELAKMGESSKGTKSTLEMRYEAIMSQQRAALKPRGANEGRARTPIRSRSPSKSPEVKKAIAKAAPKASKPIRKPTSTHRLNIVSISLAYSPGVHLKRPLHSRPTCHTLSVGE